MFCLQDHITIGNPAKLIFFKPQGLATAHEQFLLYKREQRSGKNVSQHLSADDTVMSVAMKVNRLIGLTINQLTD
jgi:hypothetical protein